MSNCQQVVKTCLWGQAAPFLPSPSLLPPLFYPPVVCVVRNCSTRLPFVVLRPKLCSGGPPHPELHLLQVPIINDKNGTGRPS